MISIGDIVICSTYKSRYQVIEVKNNTAELEKCYRRCQDSDPDQLTHTTETLLPLGKEYSKNPDHLKMGDIVTIVNAITIEACYEIVDIYDNERVEILDTIHDWYGGEELFIDLNPETRSRKEIMSDYAKQHSYSGI